MEQSAPEQKQERKGQSSAGWWWTLIGRVADCDGCGEQLQPPQKIAYNYGSKKVYCPDCARKESVATMCRPSRKLQKVQQVAA